MLARLTKYLTMPMLFGHLDEHYWYNISYFEVFSALSVKCNFKTYNLFPSKRVIS